MRKQASKKQDNKMIVVLVFATLLLGTFFHDPILHSVYALFYPSTQVTSYTSGFTSGSTDVLAIPSPSLWIFFMLPSLMIYILSILFTLKYPNKYVLITSTILLFLNLFSLDPFTVGSDSYNALQVIGATPLNTFIHIIILLLAILLLALFLKISVENNTKDAKSRIRGIFRAW